MEFTEDEKEHIEDSFRRIGQNLEESIRGQTPK